MIAYLAVAKVHDRVSHLQNDFYVSSIVLAESHYGAIDIFKQQLADEPDAVILSVEYAFKFDETAEFILNSNDPSKPGVITTLFGY